MLTPLGQSVFILHYIITLIAGFVNRFFENMCVGEEILLFAVILGDERGECSFGLAVGLKLVGSPFCRFEIVRLRVAEPGVAV